MGQIYKQVADFLSTEWAAFENTLANPADFHQNVEKMLKRLEAWRGGIEKLQPEDSEDIYSKLAARQLDAYLRLCYRDGYAPILSTLLYLVEGQVYDLLIERNLGKKRGGTRELEDSIMSILTIFAQDYPWTLYLHTLVTLQRIKRVMTRVRDAGGQLGRWAKQVETLVERGLVNAGTVLPFQISIKWLLEGLIPTQFSEKEMMEIGKLLRVLWTLLQSELKFRVVGQVPSTENEEIGKFFIDFVQGVLYAIQSKLTQTLKLPPIDVPINVVVVWGEDAKYTQSVAFFRQEGSQMSVYIFKPPQAPFYVPEEVHLLMHEGIPGHAYAVWLQERMGAGVLPIQTAHRLTRLGGLSFVDVSSIFHEGWAVFAQYIGSLLLGNEEIEGFFFRELVSYLERFLVLQHIVPLYTVKPHIPRFAEPYQFASYFVGFLLWYLLYKKKGDVWSVLVRGDYPYIPSPREVIDALNSIIELVKERRKKKG